MSRSEVNMRIVMQVGGKVRACEKRMEGKGGVGDGEQINNATSSFSAK